MSFSPPVPSNYMNNKSTSKKIYYLAYNNEKIVSPKQGTVVRADQNECGGNVMIEHIINSRKYYSNICYISKINVVQGMRVNQNEIIGFAGSDLVEFSVLDSFGNKVSIDGVFEEKKEEKKTEIEKKEKTEIKPTQSNSENLPALYKGVLDLMASPFTLIGSAFSNKKDKKIKEEIIESQNLLVEIKRINQLMK